MTIQVLPCLSCEGKGQRLNLCSNSWIPCPPCSSTGKVRRDAEWLQEGQTLRRARIAADMSLRQMARALSVSLVDLSAMERGMEAAPRGWRETAMGLRA